MQYLHTTFVEAEACTCCSFCRALLLRLTSRPLTCGFKPLLTHAICGVCSGGVAVSGLEMAQNATMTTWSSADVDERLKVRQA